MDKSFLIIGGTLTIVCTLVGVFYFSDFANETKSKTYTSNRYRENVHINSEQIPKVTDIFQHGQKESKQLDDLEEQNHLSIMKKNVNNLITEADSFIKEHNLTLDSKPISEKQRVLAQAKIDQIQNTLNTLESKLNEIGIQ